MILFFLFFLLTLPGWMQPQAAGTHASLEQPTPGVAAAVQQTPDSLAADQDSTQEADSASAQTEPSFLGALPWNWIIALAALALICVVLGYLLFRQHTARTENEKKSAVEAARSEERMKSLEQQLSQLLQARVDESSAREDAASPSPASARPVSETSVPESSAFASLTPESSAPESPAPEDLAAIRAALQREQEAADDEAEEKPASLDETTVAWPTTDDVPSSETEPPVPEAAVDESTPSELLQAQERLVHLHGFYQHLKQKKKYLDEEGYRQDQDKIDEAQAEFERWKTYLLELRDSWENTLRHEFLEILEDEAFAIARDRRVMTFPVNDKDRQRGLSALRELAHHIEMLPDHDAKDWLAGLPRISIRSRTDLDYRLADEKAPPATVALLRNQVATLVLHFKNLERAYKDLGDLITWALKKERPVFSTLHNFEPDLPDLLHRFFEEDPSAPEHQAALEQTFGKADTYLRENHQMVVQAVNIADDLRKKYFAFLDTRLFKIVNGIQEAKRLFLATTETQYQEQTLFLKKWAVIYDRLTDLFLRQTFKEKLHIEKIDCKVGEAYNPDVHTPVAESEPDDQLQDNQIKKIVNMGFQWEFQNKRIIIKPVDVIVVRNDGL